MTDGKPPIFSNVIDFLNHWIGDGQLQSFSSRESFRQSARYLMQILQPVETSPTPPPMDTIGAICHAVSGTCAHILRSPGGPCTVENCNAVRAYLGGPSPEEPKPVLEHRFIPDGSDPERCQVCPFAKAAHQNTGAEKASGEPVTLICEGCGAKAELPRIGQEANFVSVIPANGWELYPKHLCPKCVK